MTKQLRRCITIESETSDEACEKSFERLEPEFIDTKCLHASVRFIGKSKSKFTLSPMRTSSLTRSSSAIATLKPRRKPSFSKSVECIRTTLVKISGTSKDDS
ncbi:unnamed protein product [Calicophoron daubneyi]|uniref:Uncharacterized protein n=1 Tax=Calicophoron daubneyi TaxID=300641 RepID=A0AAV2TQH0_CALDB